MTSKKGSGTTTAVWFEMDEDTNRLLTQSAKANDRSKRSEALFRLKAHLKMFNHEMKQLS